MSGFAGVDGALVQRHVVWRCGVVHIRIRCSDETEVWTVWLGLKKSTFGNIACFVFREILKEEMKHDSGKGVEYYTLMAEEETFPKTS